MRGKGGTCDSAATAGSCCVTAGSESVCIICDNPGPGPAPGPALLPLPGRPGSPGMGMMPVPVVSGTAAAPATTCKDIQNGHTHQ